LASVMRKADQAHVTALSGSGTQANRGIRGHSEAFSESASPGTRRRCAPNGNHRCSRPE
jgi:hypothetical protein